MADATMIDPEFTKDGVGKTPGVLVWRIEDFKPVPVEEGYHGQFFDGDSYVVLHTVKGSDGSFSYNIHFWQGKESSKDEVGTSALKAIELDNALGGAPVQFRETQDHESSEFHTLWKSYGGVQYLEGGVASGFAHVEPDVYPTRLLQVKGRRNVRAVQVPVAASSLNAGDVFILDAGLTLYIYFGSDANKAERFKAMQVMDRLYTSRGARPTQVVVNDGPTPAFWEALGGSEADVKSAEEGGKDDEVTGEGVGAVKLFKVSDASGSLEVEEIPCEDGKLLRSSLDTTDVFIVDAGTKIYVWTGRGATKDEKGGGLTTASKFIEAQGRPSYTPVQRVVEGGETPVFKSLFFQWEPVVTYDFSASWRGGSRTEGGGGAVVEQKPIDVASLHKAAAASALVDDGSGTTKIWSIEGTEKKEYPDELRGQFFGGDSYVVQYTYDNKGSEAHILYFWLGRDSEQVEQGSAAARTVELSRTLSGHAPHVRLVQGKEPPHFVSLFKGSMIVHSGGRSGTALEGTRLYHVKGATPLDTKALQVPASASNLNSGDCFVLVKEDGGVTLWEGKGSNDDEKAVARKTADVLSGGDVTVVAEGSEDDGFWDALGGKADYPDSAPLPTGPQLPRLFSVSDVTGALVVEEVPHFTQDDLFADDVFLLDTFTQVFVWIGSGATAREKEGASDVAEKYVRGATDGRDTDQPIVTVQCGSEPPLFTANFQGWDSTPAAAFEDPYEKKLRELRAAAAAKEADEEAKSGGGAAPAPAPAAGGGDSGDARPFSDSLSLEALQGALPGGGLKLTWSSKELYLNDEEFATHLGCSKAEFAALPKWKRQNKKKGLGIF